ncbi:MULTISPECIES: hypothetical protein [Pseudomonas]|uniref:Uncharacterized protein n=1 Tax=Pseudomonas fluorescens TaxID=294 RepID=A0AAE2DKE8_PSEFL|nr:MULTISPECIES: hypothetical protein [Pseudomonas]KIF61087.1 hypothetical protein QS95_10645 [Pseudomonas fluorescens]POA40414.1 hypothetical protein C1891_02470 [Pseudomonas sp. GW456-12-1-14-TSB6]
MQWLPSFPTDNLYKLIAIFGLWLTAGLLAGMFYLSYLTYALEEETKQNIHYMNTEARISEIKKRLTSLKNNAPEENKLEWSAVFTDEMTALQKTLEISEKNLEKPKKPDNPINESMMGFLFSGDYWIYIFIAAYSLLTVTCTYFGFKLWYKKIHLPAEEQHYLDMRIKEATLLKLQVEINQIQPMPETIKQLFKLHSTIKPNKKSDVTI